MTAYVLRRLLLMIPTLFGITVITFAIIHLTPGDPVALKAQQESGMMRPGAVATQVIEETRKRYGLDQPIHVQYGRWIRQLATLDFGTSFQDGRPILTKIGEALPLTLALNAIAVLLIYSIAIPTGIYTALRPRGWFDQGTAVLFYILYSLPTFWVASLLLIFFAGGDYLNWFPLGGYLSDGAEQLSWWHRLGNIGWHFVLPVVCMTYGGYAFLSRFSRSVMLDVVRQDFIRTARAKGLREWRVVVRHGLRNALIPFVTLFGTLLPGMLGGSIIIEQIFSLPGMGKLSFEAVMGRDYPMVMAIATIDAVLTLIGLLISDLLYAVVDPRVSYE